MCPIKCVSPIKRALAVLVGAQKHLVDAPFVGACEHLLGRTILVRFGESRTPDPGGKVFEGPPPGLDLIVALGVGIIAPRAAVVVEAHGSGAVDLVAHEARGLINQVRAVSETVLEVDFVTGRDRNAIGDDNPA